MQGRTLFRISTEEILKHPPHRKASLPTTQSEVWSDSHFIGSITIPPSFRWDDASTGNDLLGPQPWRALKRRFVLLMT